MARVAFTVSLTPELEGYIAQEVSTGRYGNSSEVIRAALRPGRRRNRWKGTLLDGLRFPSTPVCPEHPHKDHGPRHGPDLLRVVLTLR
ncbi:MAG TPA: type II toxin-antitoxin system ParD family antitoxin [Hyphomicrobiaceae bacterium]|nr:type II toxin-antitoxin system ParD family antitoxin [Hyphomicrobiaceae bacterium]